MKLTLDNIINHIRNREYMTGLDRDNSRIRAYGEIFTPTDLVQELLDDLPQEIFSKPDEKFIDPAGCGDGQILGEILIRKVENGIDFETALSTIYGVDVQESNVLACRERLLCGQEHLRKIVETNIVHADCDTYDFSFNGTNKNDEALQFELLFD